MSRRAILKVVKTNYTPSAPWMVRAVASTTHRRCAEKVLRKRVDRKTVRRAAREAVEGAGISLLFA